MQTRHSQIENEPNPVAHSWEQKTAELQDLVTRYLPLFYRRAYRYLRNPHDAEDAVQDALLSAYTHLDQFKGSAKMTTWLTSIVTNSALSYLRKRPRQAHASLDEPLPNDAGTCMADNLMDVRRGPEDDCALSELNSHLMQFMSQLSPTFREAIQLRDFDELTTSEAAHLLGVPESTIKTRVSRARIQLKQHAKLSLKRKTSTTAMRAFDTLQDVTN
jgi:RNA polymerase sigma-70 factor (ECF subfamily)